MCQALFASSEQRYEIGSPLVHILQIRKLGRGEQLVAQGHIVSGGAGIQNQQFDSRAQSLYYCFPASHFTLVPDRAVGENGCKGGWPSELPGPSPLN